MREIVMKETQDERWILSSEQASPVPAEKFAETVHEIVNMWRESQERLVRQFSHDGELMRRVNIRLA